MMNGKTFKKIVIRGAAIAPRVPAPRTEAQAREAYTRMPDFESEPEPYDPLSDHEIVSPSPLPAPIVVPAAVAGKHLPKLSKDFLFAGRALFTVSNSQTDEHYTYKVRAKSSEWPVGSGRQSTSYFLSVKSSGGRWPYTYVGILSEPAGTIKCTGKSGFTPGTKEYDVAAWAIKSVFASKLIPDAYEIAHAGKCGRCAKTLTDPQSIERGIGPDCWSMMGH